MMLSEFFCWTVRLFLNLIALCALGALAIGFMALLWLMFVGPAPGQ